MRALRVIAMHGAFRTGKNTVGDILVRDHGFKQIAFADKLREMCLVLDPIVTDHVIPGLRLSTVIERHGWEMAKNGYPEVRRTMQRLATDVIRNHVNPNYWVDVVADTIADSDDDWVITDLRFANEAAAVVGLGGQVWWITRPQVAGHLDVESLNHASEAWHPDPDAEWVRHLANDGGAGQLAERVAALLADEVALT